MAPRGANFCSCTGLSFERLRRKGADKNILHENIDLPFPWPTLPIERFQFLVKSSCPISQHFECCRSINHELNKFGGVDGSSGSAVPGSAQGSSRLRSVWCIPFRQHAAVNGLELAAIRPISFFAHGETENHCRRTVQSETASLSGKMPAEME